jgi:hypothetical protein
MTAFALLTVLGVVAVTARASGRVAGLPKAWWALLSPERKGEDEAPPPLSVQRNYWRVITPVSGLLSAVRIVTTVATPAELKLPSVRYAPLLALPKAPLKPETE